ncbi:MAG: prepilin-type N-terminal cleavage/methylation domain-containing protein [Candidatus Pacebacteria bacterium]|nr:prepilin-type N-terminal cleavage/methylation domain-containing protein [Candidatus Paceibacterota bacterium]
MQKQRSFTLIELLIVIVIVGILSGFIVVNLNNHINNAKDVKIESTILSISKILKTNSLDSFPIENIACNLKTSCNTLKSVLDLPVITDDIYYKTSSSGNFFVIYASKNTDSNRSFEINSDIEKVREVPSFNNLVAYFPLSIRSSNGSTLFDMSSYSNNGNIIGSIFKEGVDGNTNTAMSFDGVDDYIAIPHNVSFDVNQFTIAMWIKTPLTMGPGHRNLLSKQGSPTRDYNFYTYSIDGITVGRIHFSSYYALCPSADLPQSYDPDTWHHVAITLDATGKETFYSDGKSFFNVQGTPAVFNNAFPIWIARADNYYKGTIDDVRIYNRALTADEINLLNNIN